MRVLVDDREPIKMMGILGSVGLECVRKRMITGDYVCEELGVCFERKSIDDMCGSIVDGRLKRQVERMKKGYEWVFVIVVGRICDRQSEIHENCLLGKIVSMVVKDGVKVLMCDSEEQFAYIVKSVLKKVEDGL